jgi:Mor family transcriptional regulator
MNCKKCGVKTIGKISFCRDCQFDIYSEYLEGKSTYKLGKKYGVSGSTIRNILIEHGIDRRNPIKDISPWK